MTQNYQGFMRPFLRIVYVAHGQEVKLRDVIESLAEQFELIDLMMDYGIGCRNEQILTAREIDESFFES